MRFIGSERLAIASTALSKRLAATSQVDFYAVTTGKVSSSIKADQRLEHLDVSRAGDVLAWAGERGTLLWSIEDGKQVSSLNDEDTLAVAFSPDGSLVASTGAQRRIHLYDRKTGVELQSLSAEDLRASKIAVKARWHERQINAGEEGHIDEMIGKGPLDFMALQFADQDTLLAVPTYGPFALAWHLK